MENELEVQLAKVIEKALQVAEKTGEFVIDQAPELLQEFYTWHLIKGSMTAFISFGFIILIYILLRRFMRSEYFDWEEGDCVGLFAFGIIVSMVPLFLFIMSIYKIVFITVAPKLYLIEYFIN